MTGNIQFTAFKSTSRRRSVDLSIAGIARSYNLWHILPHKAIPLLVHTLGYLDNVFFHQYVFAAMLL